MDSSLRDFSKVQVGNSILRVFDGTVWEAKVVEVTDGTISCKIIVDVPRTMEFSRDNGISTHGEDYGYILNYPYEDNLLVTNNQLVKVVKRLPPIKK